MPALPEADAIVRELTAAVAGRYSLERELGRGGMGAVFLARDLQLDRPVAIKVLPPELAVRPELRERFLRETRTAASFSHPNIVSVHSVEETASLLFFVMSYVDGETLTERVRREGPLPVTVAVRLLQEIAWALSYAHGRGVVHRDVKPDNILLERATGRALVMDFGIARSVAASGLTQLGETVGTPQFMSPEQAAGEKVDGRSDLYSLGVVAYYALAGRLPFQAESAQQIMAAHISQPAPPIGTHRPDLPAPLAAAIDRCLSKDPAERFPSGEAVAEALEEVRGRQTEVAPAIRIMLNKSDQFARASLIIFLLGWQLVARSRSEIEALLMGSIFVAAVFALLAQVPIEMRQLARRGFRFTDLQAGIAAVDAERAEAAALVEADPGYRRRAWRGRLLAAGLALLAFLLLAFAFTTRVSGPTGSHLSLAGAVAAFVGCAFVMGALVFAMTRMARSGRLDRRLHGLWKGRVGQWSFRLGSWHLGMSRPAASGTGGYHVLAVLDTLERGARRRLTKARTIVQQLESEVERLRLREQELDAATAEAKAGGPPDAGSSSERQQALLNDLDRARGVVLDRQVAILAVLENVRLALVRVKSRIGGTEEVERELAPGAALLESKE
ncbi:MAG TPA: serine/threonine-protein kinase [Gemmatimonadales bacterium]|jgi:serine/threonine-protein kinase